jgi:type II secretory pathway pseudopilin PulG
MMRVDSRNSSRRRAFGLVELTIATLLLGVAMTIVAQTAGWLAAERRGAERRQRALQEAANLMERLAARPWAELTPELAKAQTLSPTTKSALRDGALDVTIGPAEGDDSAKAIAIRIGWGNRAGGRVAPIRLVGWVHRRDREGGRP